MQVFHKFAAIVAIAIFSMPVAALAEQKVLISENFDAVADGAMPSNSPRPVGKLGWWRGNDPSAYLGNISVTSEKFAGASGKSVCFTDTSPVYGRGSVMTGTWEAPAGSIVRVQWKFLAPMNDVASLTFLGGSWGKAAAVFIIEAGDIKVHYAGGDKNRALVLKGYEPNKWYTVRFDLNTQTKTFNCYLDDQLILRDYEFAAGGTTVNKFEMVGDMSTIVRNDMTVLYVDDVYVACAAKEAELKPAP